MSNLSATIRTPRLFHKTAWESLSSPKTDCNRLWRGILRTYSLCMISLGRSTYLIPGGFVRVVEDLETLYKMRVVK